MNELYYIGKHKTDTPDDDQYLGSGTAINRAIQKYGRENFKKETLHDFDNPDEMDAKEAEIVNEEFINRRDNYNIAPGGRGGFSRTSEECSIQGKINAKNKVGIHGMTFEERREHGLKMAMDKKGIHAQTTEEKRAIGNNCYEQKLGIHGQSSEQRKKNSAMSATGKIRVNNGIVGKLIKPDELGEWLNKGYVRGKIDKRKKNNGASLQR